MSTTKFSLRKTLSLFLFSALAVVAIQAGCGGGDTSGSPFTTNTGEDGGGTTSGDIPPGFQPTDDSGQASSSGVNPDAMGILDVTPAAATVTVSIVDGVITAPPQTFVAQYNGQVVNATWLLDRGELGDISPAGVFTATGKNVGDGIITARYGAREGTAKIKVVINATQNGALAGVDAGGGGFGGIGGVGGEPLGGAVAPAIVTKLKTETNLPVDAAELGFLYPYDLTVWPRGLLPPLLMWQTKYNDVASVYVKLSQGNYTFEGTYLLSQFPTNSDAKKRVRLEETAWKTATGGNQGDDLKLEVKIYSPSNDKVYGPITRTWKVAPGVLKGTVYYNSYDSQITTGGVGETGGVIKIKPRSPEPELAVPSMAGKCHVCHTVSADGSTLFVQDGKIDWTSPKDNYANGASYDLKQSSPPRTDYLGATTPAQDRKFVWSAPYPDGSFALASSHWAREAYLKDNSKLFRRSDGGELASTGLTTAVQSAVTPAFAPDGRKVAFNFWEGAGAGGVTAGAGRSLAIMDFTCGAAPGAITCAGSPIYAFSNLREIYRDATRWPGWPTFLPDGKAVVFHNATHGGECAPPQPNNTKDAAGEYIPFKDTESNCQLSTWYYAKSELWVAHDGIAQNARRLDAANGNGTNLPTSTTHVDDTLVNYQPTVNPVASGGYYWVVFTSRRLYGNLITGTSWGANGAGGGPIKKLWVAAIDINNPNPTIDPSHPAFYLPGQELDAGNTRGFWVVDPCKSNGSSCETGDECCNGFCRKDADGGALVCIDKPPGGQCSQEFEKCTVDADCCDPKFLCIAGKCTRPDPVIK